MSIERVVLFLFLVGLTPIVHAQELSPTARQAIERQFPGATITEVEPGSHLGSPVTEVDVTMGDGKSYELLLSESGQILSVAEEEALPWLGGELSVGLAVRAEREIYKDVGTETEPSPFLLYENGPLEILSYDDFGILWKVYEKDWFSAGLSGTIQLEEGYDADDSDYLTGMDELSTVYTAGFELEAEFDAWSFGLEFQRDVSNEHDGSEIDLLVSYETEFAGCQVQPMLNLTWMDSKNVDYFYGVSAAEALPNRPAYDPGSSFEIEAEVLVLRELGAGFSAVGLAGISAYGSDITDSPIVDEDYGFEATFGIMYTL